MQQTPDRILELVALGVFVLALAHTFAAKQLERLSRRFPRHAGLFHPLGEIEVVFGLWAIVYLALGVLFGSVSIGGTLTSYAAPPVLIVATTWHWDSGWMLSHFGWKAAVATAVNATIATCVLRKHLRAPAPAARDGTGEARVPSLDAGASGAARRRRPARPFGAGELLLGAALPTVVAAAAFLLL